MTGDPLLILQGLLLVPAVVGSVYALLRLPAIAAFQRRPRAAGLLPWPPVSVLKPICGLEKELEENLRSMCDQDYPDYQVVFVA